MSNYSEAFTQAQQLLAQIPLPEDAEARLEKLEKAINTDEQDKFGDLWSAFYAASDSLLVEPV